MQRRVVHVLDAGKAENRGKHEEQDLTGKRKGRDRILVMELMEN
jgi:hypothetical protein